MRTFLFVLFLSPFVLQAQSADNYPSLEEVVEVFFSQYTVLEPDMNFLRFERRPDGYAVVKMKDPYVLESRKHFFRYPENSYSALRSFEKKAGQDARKLTEVYLQSVPEHDRREYREQPYYGYPGWYKDVIALYQNRESLSDRELHALGRACQAASASLLGLTTFNEPADVFDLPSGNNAFSTEQLKQFLDLANTGIDAYFRLWQQNPEYLTSIGPVWNKYSFELMHAFIVVLYYQNEETARKLLKPNLYHPVLLEDARNLLQSCPAGSVLITYGDLDTYSLYYLQATEGFRTDVIVVNLSLLVVPRYLQWIYSGGFGAQPLQTRLPERYFRELALWLNATPANTTLQIDIDTYFKMLQDTSKYSPGWSETYAIFAPLADTITLSAPPGVSFFDATVATQASWKAVKPFAFPDTYVPLDMIYANNWTRPVCYAITCRPEAFACWNPHLVLEGLVYRIYPDLLEPVDQVGDGQVNTGLGYTFWKTEFRIDTVTTVSSVGNEVFHSLYFVYALRLAETLLAAGDTLRASDIARSLPRRLPNAVQAWDLNWIHAVTIIAACGDPALGERIALQLLDNYDANLIYIPPQTGFERVWSDLARIAEQYELKVLKKRLEEYR